MPGIEHIPGPSKAESREYNVGLVVGSLWLIGAGCAFAILELIAVKSSFADFLVAAVSAIAIGLIFRGVGMIRRAIRLPSTSLARPKEAGRIRLQFGIVVLAEVLGCAVVSVGCLVTHRWRFTVPLNVIVVGIHFIPLAHLFAVARYYLLGALFCLIPMATMIFVSRFGHIGQASSWVFLPAVGCGLSALLIGYAGLKDVRRFLNKSGIPMS